MKNVKKLEKNFIGVGEVKEFVFVQKKESEKGYIYEVSYEECTHYEVFEKKETPICIDFEKKIFSETEFKEIYPKSEAFGSWAFTFQNYEKAVEKFNNL